jgi:flagellar hook-length control protein FliK
MDNQGKGGKLQQTRPTSGETQNTANTIQPSKTSNDQVLVAKQVQYQSADTAQIMQDTGTGQTKGNNIQPRVENNAVRMNDSANHSLTDSGKSAILGNQSNLEKSEQSVGQNNQSASILLKNQLPALSIEASVAGSNTTRVPDLSSAGGQKTSTETSSRDHVKDGAGVNKQENSQRFTGVAKAGPLTEKLNAEKIELSLDKNGTQKSDSGNVATQSVRGQIMSFGANDAVSVNRPINVDRGASAGANSQTDLSGEALAKSDTVADIREQISLAVQGSLKQGQQQITINLNPPELGRVTIKFTESNHELTGLLETENSQTRAEIRQAIPDIIRSLEESGINIKRLDVMLSDSSARSDLTRQSAQQNLRDNASQDLWQQFGNHNYHDTAGNQLSYNSFVTPANLSSSPESYGQSSPGPQQSSSSDKLLDVLI